MVIFGTSFKEKTKELCVKYDIKLLEIDLSTDFKDLEKRPYGKEYPIECFYHFYGYKLFSESDFIIQIEPDIYTNKKIDIDLDLIQYIGGSYTKGLTIDRFRPIMNDYNKIKMKYGDGDIKQHRIRGGIKVYNIKGLEKIKFYETIVEYFQTSFAINAPRCGDDSLMVLYQLLNPHHVTLLTPEFHIIDCFTSRFQDITFYHFCGANPKYWRVIDCATLNEHQRYFYDSIMKYIYNNFSIEFIKTYLPEIKN
jgi:hypothetical protein